MSNRVDLSGPFLAVLAFGFVLVGCSETSVTAESDQDTSAAASAPGSEIFLASLDTSEDDLQVGSLERMTDRPGYDNQPAFSLNGTSLLWTSVREGQADIFRFPLTEESADEEGAFPLTHTPVSEFSPTPRTDGGMSVVRVEFDGRQRLWHYTSQGAPVDPILPEADSVGYHAWLDRHRLALFMLGSPPTLHLVNLATDTDTVVASNVGRSLQPVPDRSAVSFIQIDDDSTTSIHVLDGDSFQTQRLTSTPGEGTGVFHAWTPDGRLLMAVDSELMAWSSDEDEWRTVTSLDTLDVSRLAVDPAGSRLALVAAED